MFHISGTITTAEKVPVVQSGAHGNDFARCGEALLWGVRFQSWGHPFQAMPPPRQKRALQTKARLRNGPPSDMVVHKPTPLAKFADLESGPNRCLARALPASSWHLGSRSSARIPKDRYARGRFARLRPVPGHLGWNLLLGS